MRQSHSLAGRIAAAALVLAGAVAGTALVSTELADAADAARRAPRSTHIGIPVDDIVVLDLIDTDTTTPKFVRVHPDATRDTSTFTVPEGRAFVLTSYHAVGEWGRGIAVRFWISNPDSEDQRVVFSATNSGITEIASSYKSGEVRGTVPEGVVFAEGMQLAIDSVAPGNLGHRKTLQAFDPTGDFQVNVGGYLVNAD